MKKELEYYLHLEYETVLKESGGSCFLISPDLGIVGKGENFSEAYESFQSSRRLYFEEMLTSNSEDYIPQPNKKQLRDKLKHNYYPFFLKLLFASVVFIVLTLLPFSLFNSLVEEIPDKLKASTEVFRKPEPYIIEGLKKFNSEMEKIDPEKKSMILDELKKAVENLKPFTNEVGALFNE